jgi:hypothetical protein
MREKEAEIRERMAALLVSDRKGTRTDRSVQWLAAAATQGHALAVAALARVTGEAGGLLTASGVFPVVGPAYDRHLALPNPVCGNPRAAPFHAPTAPLGAVLAGGGGEHLGGDTPGEREGLGRLRAGDSPARAAYRTAPAPTAAGAAAGAAGALLEDGYPVVVGGAAVAPRGSKEVVLDLDDVFAF